MTKNKWTVRPPNRRTELKMQNKIIDSYRAVGGQARKWATEVQVGVPDLVASLPDIGLHLVEVKHRPAWAMSGVYDNPLAPIQAKRAREYVAAGALVLGAVVVGATVRGSSLVLFDPTAPKIDLNVCSGVVWAPGRGYPMREALNNHLLLRE